MTSRIRIALYQPDIPGNTGTILRMAACLGVAVDIVEPAGFDMSDRALRRAGMDYAEQAAMRRHRTWNHFLEWNAQERRRLILATTQAEQSYRTFAFRSDDILLFGRESAGAPEDVHRAADARLCIPMVDGHRSLNLAISTALFVGEALRQTVDDSE
ncbi:MAG: tRNA (cytidine(34)-2'-O)-methyltransferase [Alphaproteobacteria bacterium]|nr:tRNA (cytidine(34)-2'-O)-methyltransferase [Alphaproteobacteria bacterium]